jgi:hypothetical protein
MVAVYEFEVFTAVAPKNAVFWEVKPCSSFKNRHFGGTCHLHHQGDNRQARSNIISNWQPKQAVRKVTANVVPSSSIRVTLMMEAIRSSETPVLTRATEYKIPEDGILLAYSLSKTSLKTRHTFTRQPYGRKFPLFVEIHSMDILIFILCWKWNLVVKTHLQKKFRHCWAHLTMSQLKVGTECSLRSVVSLNKRQGNV